MNSPLQISFQNYLVGNVRLGSVSIDQGLGFYLLRIGCQITTVGRAEAFYCLEDLRLVLYVPEPGTPNKIKFGTARPVGLNILRTGEYEGMAGDTFELQVSPQQLGEIEERRLGNDLKLSIELRGRVYPIQDRTLLLEVFQTGEFVVPENHWLTELRKAGAANVAMLMVELPDATRHPTMRRPLEEICKGRDLLLQGHYEAAVTHCRRALEALTEVLGEKDELSAVTAAITKKETREALTVRQRILALRVTTSNLASLGAHPSATTTPYSYQEARLVVAQTALLIGYAANLARSPKFAV